MNQESLDVLIDRRDSLRRKRRVDVVEFGALLQRIADHPDASADGDFPGMLMDLAEWNANAGRYDETIQALERAVDAGLEAIPDPRCDLADYHLRAGRSADAAALFADVRRDTPDDVWLYNAAGLAYSGVGDDETAVRWLDEGVELAMRDDDPENVVAQLVDSRAESRRRLGLGDPDELERRADAFLDRRRAETVTQSPAPRGRRGTDEPAQVSAPGQGVAAAVAVVARGELDDALARWSDLREEWKGVEEDAYLRAMDARAAELRRQGVPVRGMALLRVAPFEAWERELGLVPAAASTRSRFAADRLRHRRRGALAAGAERAVLVGQRQEIQAVLRLSVSRSNGHGNAEPLLASSGRQPPRIEQKILSTIVLALQSGRATARPRLTPRVRSAAPPPAARAPASAAVCE